MATIASLGLSAPRGSIDPMRECTVGEELRVKSKLLCVAIAFFGVISASHADVFNITYTGTIASGNSAPVGNQILSGNDSFGFFGPANSSLVGDTFSLVYIFDTSKGALNIAPQSTQLYGGTSYTGNFPSPGFAILTINGNSVIFGGNVGSQTQWVNQPNDPIVTVGSVYTTTNNLDNSAYVSQADTAIFWQRIYNDPTGTTTPLMVGTPFSISAGPNDYVSGYFVLNAGDQPLASGLLDATTLTVSSAVPEPSVGGLLCRFIVFVSKMESMSRRESIQRTTRIMRSCCGPDTSLLKRLHNDLA
jgi:hypothetical protein